MLILFLSCGTVLQKVSRENLDIADLHVASDLQQTLWRLPELKTH